MDGLQRGGVRSVLGGQPESLDMMGMGGVGHAGQVA